MQSLLPQAPTTSNVTPAQKGSRNYFGPSKSAVISFLRCFLLFIILRSVAWLLMRCTTALLRLLASRRCLASACLFFCACSKHHLCLMCSAAHMHLLVCNCAHAQAHPCIYPHQSTHTHMRENGPLCHKYAHACTHKVYILHAHMHAHA